MTDAQTAIKIEQARQSLTEKLAELQRRAAHARAALSPSTYWANPLIRFGIGAALGYMLGAAPRGRAEPGSLAGRPHPSTLDAIVRATLTAATTVIVREILGRRAEA